MVSSLALQIYFSVVAINQATNYKTFFSPHLPSLFFTFHGYTMVFRPHFTSALASRMSLPGQNLFQLWPQKFGLRHN
jgi:hypothetical protein